MSFEVSETQRTPRKSYVQMAARRANGDKVYITGDSRREVEKIRRLLMGAARRTGLKMLEIAQAAEVAAIVMQNPGAPDVVRGIAPAPHPRDRTFTSFGSSGSPTSRPPTPSSMTTTLAST
jgi:hypothetical protein